MKIVNADLTSAFEVLSARGWLSERTAEFRQDIAKIARFREFEAGVPLYLYGDVPNGLFGLVEGALDIAIPRSDGMEVTVHQAETGFWIGDLALLAGQTRVVSVIAARRSLVAHLPDQALRRLVAAKPNFYADFYALTHGNMALALRLLANLSTFPSDARVAARILMHDEDAGSEGLQLSQAKLAELVALSPPTLQRVLRRLQENDLVELGYGRIRVLDRRGLLALCGSVGTL